MSDPRKFHPWSWCRELLSQGGDIYHDRMPGGYEVYSARLDAAAREREDELAKHCVPCDVADQMAEALTAIGLRHTAALDVQSRALILDAIEAYRKALQS